MSLRSKLENIVNTVPQDQLPDLVGELARLQAVLSVQISKIHAPKNGEAPKNEKHLTAGEVSEILNVSKKWVYANADKLGVVRLSAGTVRFPRAAVDRYIRAMKQ